MVAKAKDQKDLRAESTIKGMKNFRQTPDGTFILEALGPSGIMIEGRLTLDRTFRAR